MGITSELTVYGETDGKELWFTATVENSFRGLVRLNVAQGEMDNDDPVSS